MKFVVLFIVSGMLLIIIKVIVNDDIMNLVALCWAVIMSVICSVVLVKLYRNKNKP